MLASQSYGTVEVADIIDATIVLRLSNFSSVIVSLNFHGTTQSISTLDGNLSLFSTTPQTIECIYHIKPDPTISIGQSFLSPDFEFILLVTEKKWSLYDSQTPLFFRNISEIKLKGDDSFSTAQWLSSSRFAVCTFSGFIEIWECDKSFQSHIFSRFECHDCIFKLSSIEEKSIPIHPHVIQPPEDKRKSTRKPPTLVFSLQSSPGSVIGFTSEGFIVSSVDRSRLTITSQNSELIVDLRKYFTNKIRCRCPVGRPIKHEVCI